VSDPAAGQHPFDEATALRPGDQQVAGQWEGRTHPAYANMVGPFGGVTAAQMLAAVMKHPARLGEPIALTVNYAAGLADGAFRVTAVPARTNRSTQHWTIELRQAGADGLDSVAATATAVTAQRRQTWSAVDLPMPPVEAPQAVPAAVLARAVAWIERYEMRPLHGHMPQVWDGSESESLTQLWMRDNPPRSLDFLSLTALADVFYPRVWRRRATMTPVGTVSMTVYFHVAQAELSATGQGYVLGQARSQSFFNGFFDQSAQLWNQAGHLLATTHQIVYFKE